MRYASMLWGNVKYSAADNEYLVNQAGHGFTAGDAIRHNGTIWVKAQGDNAVNAQTMGIVSRVPDVDSFYFKVDGFIAGTWTPGTEYFLSTTTAGLITTEPESFSVGEVRQSLGWGTDKGLKVEIDVGDEIQAGVLEPVTGIQTEYHVVGDGSSANKVKLKGDEPSPLTANKYYGSDKDSTEGFHSLPSEAVQTLTGTTPTFDMEYGRGATITLTGNTVITFANLLPNDTGHIEVKQDTTGGWTLTFAGATIEISENSYEAANQVALTGVANSNDVVVWWYTGSIMKIAVVYNFLT